MHAQVVAEKRDYDTFVSDAAAAGDVDLDMTMRIVDGDTLIADSAACGGFLAATKAFEAFLAKRTA